MGQVCVVCGTFRRLLNNLSTVYSKCLLGITSCLSIKALRTRFDRLFLALSTLSLATLSAYFVISGRFKFVLMKLSSCVHFVAITKVFSCHKYNNNDDGSKTLNYKSKYLHMKCQQLHNMFASVCVCVYPSVCLCVCV